MTKQKKTNAMRILDSKKISYDMYIYDTKDGMIDGISVANKIDKPTNVVFKTLVTQGSSKGYHVFIIPVEKELDLKKAAKASGEKKVEMIPVKDITKVTGYIKGGCSPIGMKKLFTSFIDIAAANIPLIIVSAGKVGSQIELKLEDLVDVINAKVVDIIK